MSLVDRSAKISATLKGRKHSRERIEAIVKARWGKNPVVPVGSIFGSWTVVGSPVSFNNQRNYPCRCSCGTEKPVAWTHLKRGNSTCCSKCQGGERRQWGVDRSRLRDGQWIYRAGKKNPTWAQMAVAECFEKQHGKCPICLKNLKEDFSDGCLDHDHETGIVRALVHRGCNVLIGWFERDRAIAERVHSYLGGNK